MARFRSVGAVIAGLLFIVVTTTLVDAVLHAVKMFPPIGEPVSNGLLAVATAYRIVLSIAGCYLTARLAPRNPMRHAMALGVIGVILSTGGTIATWNGGPAFGGKWYPIALILVSLPCAWIGAKLYQRGPEEV